MATASWKRSASRRGGGAGARNSSSARSPSEKFPRFVSCRSAGGRTPAPRWLAEPARKRLAPGRGSGVEKDAGIESSLGGRRIDESASLNSQAEKGRPCLANRFLVEQLVRLSP